MQEHETVAIDDTKQGRQIEGVDAGAGDGERAGPPSSQMRETLESTRHRLAQTERRLGEARAAMAALERRRALDAALVGADVIDIESARLLAEADLARGDDADIEDVVGALRSRKPHLFASGRTARSGPASSVMAGEVGAGDALAEAAKEARGVQPGGGRRRGP